MEREDPEVPDEARLVAKTDGKGDAGSVADGEEFGEFGVQPESGDDRGVPEHGIEGKTGGDDGDGNAGGGDAVTRFTIVPVSLVEANGFVTRHHRHHSPTVGHKFSVGILEGKELRGVAIVGRPVARMLDDGFTLEVTRVATDGVKDGCSALYGACRRAAFALGYRRLVTYILESERGTSLKAAGWRCLGEAGGGSWSREDRPRFDKHPLQTKIRFEVTA